MLRHVVLAFMSVTLMIPIAAMQTADTRPSFRIGDAPADLRPAIARADLAIVTLQSAVLTEQAEATAEGLPSSVESCHLYVVSAAYWIRRREGIELGRTSDRLRDPANAPRPWAAAIVAQHAGRRVDDVDGFVVDLGDRIGVLRPVIERPGCSACHGPREKLDPRVRAEIDARYPLDRAVGYRDGDLRGWFWVEVPKR